MLHFFPNEIQTRVVAHFLGFFKISISLFSSLPSSTLWLYSQAIRGGAETMTPSTRGFAFAKPNLTPLSQSKLNSRYLPLRKSCHCFCCSVKGRFLRRSTIGNQDGIQAFATLLTNSIVSGVASMSSKNIPPVPRCSLRAGCQNQHYVREAVTGRKGHN